MIGEWIINLTAFAVSLPLLTFLILVAVLSAVTGKVKRGILYAADAAVILFALSIYFKLLVLSDTAVYGGIFLFLLLVMFAVLIYMISSSSSVPLSKAFKKCWRFSFLILLPLSTILAVFGAVRGILEYI
ncbi:DUF3397 family protein [Metabacillus indicus]|uniref:DUF3397 family protein n=1 Tax=Metabacillus indicus TaxID=246786 RepID=UPI003CECD557